MKFVASYAKRAEIQRLCRLLFVLLLIVPLGRIASAQTPIVNGGNYTGTLVRGAQQQWTFNANAGDAILVSMSEVGPNTAFYPYVRVYGPDGTLQRSDEGDLYAQVAFRAPLTGTYTALAARYDGADAGGDYVLTLAQAPMTVTVPVGDEGGPITSGPNFSGTVSRGDLDQWTFNANAHDAIVVSMSEVGPNTAFYPYLRVYGPDGNLQRSDEGDLYAQAAFAAPLTGTYTVVAGRYDASDSGGQYAITLAQSPAAITISAGDEGGPIVSGANYPGTVSRGDLDQWTFNAAAGDGIVVSMSEVGLNTTFYPYLRVYGPDGTLQRSDEGDLYAEVAFRAAITGAYTIVAGRYDASDAGGQYILTLAQSPAAITISAGDEGGAITSGANFSGTVLRGDLDQWTFNALANSSVSVTMSELGPNTGFYPYLRVYGPDGNLDRSDEGDLLASINFTAPLTGTYTIVAGRYDASDGLGTYQLTALFTSSGAPRLVITKSHLGNFQPGQTGATYNIIVKNTGTAATTGTVTVTDVFPVVLTYVLMSGNGWSCSINGCVRSDALAPGASYPPITVTVNVSASAPATVTNQANVIGGASIWASANDVTNITNSPPPPTTSPLQFVPIAPCRVIDTRNPPGNFGGPFLAAGASRSVAVQASSCGIPSTVQAFALNITVVPRTSALGYLTVWPAGQSQPVVSTLNSPDGSVLANAAIVPAGTGGAVNLFASNDTDAIIDVNGYFIPPAANSLQFFPLTPCRVLDTRNANGNFGGPFIGAGASRSFPIPSSSCGVPPSAQAYSFNVTVVPHGGLGYLTAWPTGQTQPLVSTLNSQDGTVLANAAIVPAGSGGATSFYASNDTDVVLDINGYFAPPGTGGLNFYTATPCRIVDTRNANGDFGGPILGANASRSVPVPSSSCGLPSDAAGYSLNMTVVPQGPLGYLSTWPTGQSQPGVSTLNAGKGIVIANAAVVPAGSGGAINVFATNPTHVVIDANGYFK